MCLSSRSCKMCCFSGVLTSNPRALFLCMFCRVTLAWQPFCTFPGTMAASLCNFSSLASVHAPSTPSFFVLLSSFSVLSPNSFGVDFGSTMLPSDLFSSYQAYKADTTAFTAWLSDCAKALGLSPVTPSPRPMHKNKTLKQTKYNLTNSEIIRCAQQVASRGRQIPLSIVRAAERAIVLRQRFAERYGQQKQTDEDDEIRERHGNTNRKFG